MLQNDTQCRYLIQGMLGNVEAEAMGFYEMIYKVHSAIVTNCNM